MIGKIGGRGVFEGLPGRARRRARCCGRARRRPSARRRAWPGPGRATRPAMNSPGASTSTRACACVVRSYARVTRACGACACAAVRSTCALRSVACACWAR